MTVFFLNFLSAVAALVAAYFWWASARVVVPKELGVSTFASDDNSFGPTPEKAWATKSSKLNSRGATAAATSAFLMAISILAAQDWSIFQ